MGARSGAEKRRAKQLKKILNAKNVPTLLKRTDGSARQMGNRFKVNFQGEDKYFSKSDHGTIAAAKKAAKAELDKRRRENSKRQTGCASGHLPPRRVKIARRPVTTTGLQMSPHGLAMRPETKDAAAVKEVFESRAYEAVAAFCAAPGDRLLDAGAHIGSWTVRATQAMEGRGAITAIELDPANLQLLLKNLHLLKVQVDLGVVHGALGEQGSVSATSRAASSAAREVTDTYRSRAAEHGSSRAGDVCTVQVPGLSFQQLRRLAGGHFCLGKLDIEGAEWHALKRPLGAPPFLVLEAHLREGLRTLARSNGEEKPTVSGPEKRQEAIDAMKSLAEEAGYQSVAMKNVAHWYVDPIVYLARDLRGDERRCPQCKARRVKVDDYLEKNS